MRVLRLLVAGLTVFAATSSSAPAQDRVWGASGLYGDIVATDCLLCGEDLGITISCQGVGSDAMVRVPFAAVDRPPMSPAPLEVIVDGQSFRFSASTEEQGLVGFVPTFELPANHPLVDALAGGQAATVEFGNISATIGLTGSRQALEIFRAHCGWYDLPAYQGPLEVATDEGALWSIGQFPDPESGRQFLGLSYGIPETDAVLFSASCAMDGVEAVDVLLGVDYGPLADGDPTQVQISAGGRTFVYPAQVFADGDERSGVRFAVGARAPLWQALSAGGEFGMGIPGGIVAAATDRNVRGAVAAFTAACFPGAASLAVVPSPAQPEAVQPVVGGTPGDVFTPLVPAAPAEQPAVPVAQPVAPVAQPAPGGPTTFTCDDGTTAVVVITGASPNETALLTIGAEPPLTMKVMASPAGRILNNGATIMMINPGMVQLVRNGKPTACRG